MSEKHNSGLLWVSCPRFTVKLTVKNGLITDAAPIVRRFIGQPYINLITWFRKFGLVHTEWLDDISLKEGV